ncbi:putative bifunctional diguanylate cyclase/phosphodiesterase [Methyloversatilis discipulorum]|uniref:putative bifunctional diguanylate cyclase/phosphodiesterase n=1 Tax=Methyloversatilis discipulorum TaxID=1119528 RepID=UPI003F361F4E
MQTGGCTMAVVSALFSCSAMDMPCTQHVSFPDAFSVAVGDAPQAATTALLRLSHEGRIIDHTGWPDTLTDVRGQPVHRVFRELDNDGQSGWPAFRAGCGNAVSRQIWHLHDGGRPVCVECAPLPGDASGHWLLRVSHGTPEDAAQRELRLLARAAHQAGDAVLITCAGGLIEYVNPAFERSTGYSAEEVLGRSPGLLKSGLHGPDVYARLWRALRSGEVFRMVFTNRRKNGELYHEEKTISPIRDAQQRISHYVATSRDVSERIRAQDQLEYLAGMDALTDLPNRRLFTDRLRQAMRRAMRTECPLAVLFIDLDRFKVINDTLGHSVGDALLTEVAARLRGCVRASDTVARLGGDEFTVLLEETGDRTAVTEIAEKILAALAEGVRVQGREFFVSASVGIALFPENGHSVDELLSRADLSMYRAKAAGRNTLRFYDQSMDAHAHTELSAEIALHGALERREFFLVYQPIIDTRTGRVATVEALLRWNSPTEGVVPPDRFIPLLEETGLIVPVSRWSLREALRDLRMLQATQPQLHLAFNLSGRQLRDDDLVSDITSALQEAGVDPRMLELEITESTLMEDIPRTTDILGALDTMGISLAIDDFGTGYSSLAYLMRFAVRTLKIDRSFVSQLRSSSDAVTIVRAITSLADSMGLEVVAEGVETPGQLAQLTELGCHRLQGYLFSRPVRPEELLRLSCFSPAAPQT